MWLGVVLGCTQNDFGTVPSEPVDTPSDPTPPDDTGAEPPAPAPCEVEAGLAVVEVTVDQPWNENEAALAVTLSSASSLAVACTLADDPTEVHLVESAAAATAHELRLSGLLANADYECVAAPVCPAAAAAHPFSIRTGEPPNLPEVETTTYGDAGTDYILFNHMQDCGSDLGQLLVVDRDGRIRWRYRTPDGVGPSVEFRYHGDDQFEWGGGWGPNALGRPRKVDLFDGETYDSAVALGNVEEDDFHHDGKQLPDGRLLTLEQVRVDAQAGDFDGFRVRRIDPVTDTVDFDYHSQRAFDEDHLPRGFGDTWHANWVDVVDETLFVSLCFVDRVVAIDVATGDWRWTFGEDGDFTLFDADGDPLDDDGFTDCQHGLEYRADDHLLVYDNGVDRGYSRVSEYALDTAAMTATRLWTWTEDDWYETTLGDADYLPNGHVLVAAGHSECFSSNPGDRTTVWEVDPVAGEKVWEMRYRQVDETAYRADSADACTLFANARYCPEIGERLTVLAPLFAR